VGAELFVRLVVGAFAEKVEIELRKDGRKTVRVLELRFVTLTVTGAKPIWENLSLVREHGLKKSVRMDALGRKKF
jgi:hypothetical protein